VSFANSGAIGRCLVRLACAGAVIASVIAAASPAAPRYTLVKTVSLGPPDKWDFIHFDPAQKRVYVAHRTQIDVIDGTSGRVIGRVSGIAGAHDVATVPALGRGYADNSDSGEVTVFDLKTLKPLGTIPADADSDAMAYDPVTGRLVVANGDAHDVSIIDVAHGARLANVPLGGSPEMLAPDGHGKVFVNVASSNTIVRLDLRRKTIDARWPTIGCDSPHGLAIDIATRRLFLSCKNAQMVVLDAVHGKRLASLPIGRGSDGAAFDPVRKLAFSSNEDGTLSVIAEQSPTRFISQGNVRTAPGARTMAIDTRNGRVFMVTGEVTRKRPPKKPGEAPDYTFAPGSARLLIFDPGR